MSGPRKKQSRPPGQTRRARNLGKTGLRVRRRGDPMAAYDAAPAPLRAWMAQAALPWSPASCLAIWRRAMAAGADAAEALARLDRAERKTLSRAVPTLPAPRRADCAPTCPSGPKRRGNDAGTALHVMK
jgi:hypothetical protein